MLAQGLRVRSLCLLLVCAERRPWGFLGVAPPAQSSCGEVAPACAARPSGHLVSETLRGSGARGEGAAAQSQG